MVNIAAGAAYGTAKAGATIAASGVFGPNIIMTALLPVIMAGILAIYGLVVAVFISTSRKHQSCITSEFCSGSNDRISVIHVRLMLILSLILFFLAEHCILVPVWLWAVVDLHLVSQLALLGMLGFVDI